MPGPSRRAAAGGAFFLAAALACSPPERPSPKKVHPVAAALSVTDVLSGSAEGYERALTPRDFSFPGDHGPHPGFRNEWWYFTGNLEAPAAGDEEARRFGFQLTFFRNQLAPQPAERTSVWAAHEVYMTHFTVTDVAGKGFHACERFSRAALGLAGAQSSPFRVWIADWVAEGGDGVPPMRLRAAEGPVAIDLELAPGKPLVLQGDRGLSFKGGGPGNASYYYSFTRLPARGTIEVEGRRFAVSGLAWMDREWSTSALAAGQVGWDWFSLQLADGRDLMLYQLRRMDGSADPASAGTLIEADGTARPIDYSTVGLEPLDFWTSPATGARYPSRWRLALPAEGLELTLTPLLEGQELDLTLRYWEGAVEISGRGQGRPASGYGYVEMTGYSERPSP